MKNKKVRIHTGMKNEYVNVHTDEQQMRRLNPLIQILVIKTLHLITVRAFYNVEKQIYPCKKKLSFIQTIAKYKPLHHPADLSVLHNYAYFTQEYVSRIAQVNMPLVRKSMYREAYRAGKCLRTVLFIRNDVQARRLLFWLYKNIGIDLTGPCPGTVCVARCYFSQFYTPHTCQVMSAMDKGIFAGLFGGGSLIFEERITEGCPCCKANFKT